MNIQLRTYIFLDDYQPQLASYTAATVKGYLPIPHEAALWVEVAPGMAINRITDIAQKGADVKPALQVVERAFGVLEVHGAKQDEVQSAGEQILRFIEKKEEDRVMPKVVSSEIITGIDPYQCMIINRFRKGALLIPGQTLFILEVQPAVYSVYAANEAEKASPISLIDIQPIGAFGRLYLGGTESAIHEASKAALSALSSIKGVPNTTVERS